MHTSLQELKAAKAEGVLRSEEWETQHQAARDAADAEARWLQARIAELVAASTNLREELEAVSEQAQRHSNRLEQQLKEAEAEVQGAQTEVQKLRAELAQSKEQAMQEEARHNRDLADLCSKFEAERADAQRHWRQLEQEDRDLGAELQAAKAETVRLQARLAEDAIVLSQLEAQVGGGGFVCCRYCDEWGGYIVCFAGSSAASFFTSSAYRRQIQCSYKAGVSHTKQLRLVQQMLRRGSCHWRRDWPQLRRVR